MSILGDSRNFFIQSPNSQVQNNAAGQFISKHTDKTTKEFLWPSGGMFSTGQVSHSDLSPTVHVSLAEDQTPGKKRDTLLTTVVAKSQKKEKKKRE